MIYIRHCQTLRSCIGSPRSDADANSAGKIGLAVGAGYLAPPGWPAANFGGGYSGREASGSGLASRELFRLPTALHGPGRVLSLV